MKQGNKQIADKTCDESEVRNQQKQRIGTAEVPGGDMLDKLTKTESPTGPVLLIFLP